MNGAHSIRDERPRPSEPAGRSREDGRPPPRLGRGKLTIFFGAPGVGKTSAMLAAARAARDKGLAVLIGVVENHGADTAALLTGLEVLPRRTSRLGAVTSAELDLDGALVQRPDVLLVDDLAHANVEGARHAKRWQDVEDLLDAGISVHATLGVHQIESLHDVVAETTGVRVRETVPDRIFERADEVRLVDLLPDELLERLGKGEEGDGDGLFTKKNLIALRALALRQTAARVDQQMRAYLRAPGVERAWPIAGRMLVCVSPSPSSARLVRATRRMAADLHTEWIAAYVETPASLRLSSSEREQVAENLRLAEQLGAEVVTLNGRSAAEESIRYARSRNVSRIVVGKPTQSRFRDLLWPRFLAEIVRGCEDIDVYVISGKWMPTSARETAAAPRLGPFEVATTLAVVAAENLIAWVLFGRQSLADVAMVFLLGVVVVAMRMSLYAATLAAVASVLSYDFFYIPPYFSFTVYEGRHLVTFGVMFFVAVVISSLTQRIREQANTARLREQRTARLYAMTRELSAARSLDRLSEVATRHLQEFFESEVILLVPGETGQLETRAASAASGASASARRLGGDDVRAAEWVWGHGQPAGAGTDTLPSASALFVPLLGSHGRVGVLGVVPRPRGRFVDAEQRQILETFAAQTAGALERARIAAEAEAARLEVETERLRSSLLSSVSHDLRTPLAVITGAATTLLSESQAVDPPVQRDLLSAIYDESVRLTRLVVNLLDMTRLSAGALKVNKEWQSIEAVVGAAIGRVEDRLGGRPLDVHVPASLPLVPFDAVLIEQVLINLLENAAKYSPAAAPIKVSASAEVVTTGAVPPNPRGVAPPEIVIGVADRGAGVPEAARPRIFEKFYRLPGAPAGGAGLGLAICRGIVEAHGGRIGVVDREGGGSRFRFTLPIEGSPPAVEEDGGAS